MPKRRYGKRKRTYRKKRRKLQAKSLRRYRGVSTQSNIPNIQKLRYATYFTLSSSLGTVQTYVFRANSIYDPDYTGSGHQPLRHDQLEMLYNHYVVLGSKITVKFLSSEFQNTGALMVGVYTSADYNPGFGNATTYIENGRGSYRLINNIGDAVKPTTCTGKFSAKKFFNVTSVKDNLTRIGASFGNNPVDPAYYQIFCRNAGGTFDNTVRCMAVIDFVVALSEPKDLDQS